MKTIADAAMTAIIAGEAIVTGAVEIFPVSTVVYDYETVQVVDIDAVANGTGSAASGTTVGITLSGFDPTDYLRVTLPAGETFTAWSYEVGTANRWVNEFDVIPDGVAAESFRLSQAGQTTSSGTHYPNGYATAEIARAAFGVHTITGASSYCFYILDTAPGGGSGTFNNDGGVSPLVEKRVVVSDTPAPDPIRLWGGYGPITLDGNVYQGIGDRGLVQQTASALGGVAQGMTIGLSGIEPTVADMVDTTGLHGASVVIHRLIFASDGKTLLDHAVWDRGRVDTIDRDEEIGGAASISLGVESAARGLGHSGARMRADADQRLIDPSDGYFKKTASAPFVTLYWGGRKPTHWGGSATRGFT